MEIKGWANYGITGHEKKPVFTMEGQHPDAVAADEIIITLPDGWETAENSSGELLLTDTEGTTYIAARELISQDGQPKIRNQAGKNITLNWREA